MNQSMKIAVVGAGAMGTLLAHKLVASGQQVSVIDRPHRASQICKGGLVLKDACGHASVVAPTAVYSEFSQAGKYDLVILATKANDLPALAPSIGMLLHDASAVMTLQNGLPWWYFQGLNGACGESVGQKEGHKRDHKKDNETGNGSNTQNAKLKLTSLDPQGELAQHIPTRHILGCVAYPAADIDKDGLVTHVEGDKFPIGELDGKEKPRTRAIAQVLEQAGFRSRILDDVRGELWLKAWGALSLNPISALTHGTMAGICEHEPTRVLVASMMEEAQSIAERLNITFRHTIEKRIAGAHGVGEHKTSMLQDREAGRVMETEALIGVMVELAEQTGVDAPSIKAINACVTLLNKSLAK